MYIALSDLLVANYGYSDRGGTSFSEESTKAATLAPWNGTEQEQPGYETKLSAAECPQGLEMYLFHSFIAIIEDTHRMTKGENQVRDKELESLSKGWRCLMNTNKNG